MSYRHLPLICECGQVPARILEIGFTTGHELVIHFWCSKCNRVYFFSKPLTECWRECPQPKTRHAIAPPKASEPTADDARFLHSMGVTFLDEKVDSC